MKYQSDKYLGQLAAFVLVVESGGFTAAANAYGLRKATLSYRVKTLEKSLDVLLLIRTTRSLRLTDEGERFFSIAREALALARQAAESVVSEKTCLAGTLRISIAPPVADFVFKEALMPMALTHPLLKVELDKSARYVDLSAEPIDLAIRVGPLVDSALGYRKVGMMRDGWYASPDYLQKACVPDSPDCLRRHCLLDLKRTYRQTQWPFNEGGATAWITINPRLLLPDFPSLLHAAVQGMGIVRASVYSVESFLEKDLLVPILENFVLPAQPLFAVYPKGGAQLDKVNVALEYITEAFDKFLSDQVSGDRASTS